MYGGNYNEGYGGAFSDGYGTQSSTQSTLRARQDDRFSKEGNVSEDTDDNVFRDDSIPRFQRPSQPVTPKPARPAPPPRSSSVQPAAITPGRRALRELKARSSSRSTLRASPAQQRALRHNVVTPSSRMRPERDTPFLTSPPSKEHAVDSFLEAEQDLSPIVDQRPDYHKLTWVSNASATPATPYRTAHAPLNRSVHSYHGDLDRSQSGQSALDRSRLSQHEIIDRRDVYPDASERSTMYQEGLNRSNVTSLNRSTATMRSRASTVDMANRSATSPRMLNRSILSRDRSVLSASTHVDLGTNVDAVVPVHHQNGHARPVKDTTLERVTSRMGTSGGSLARSLSRVTLYGKDYQVPNALFSLTAMTLLGLVLAFCNLQLLFRLNDPATPLGGVGGRLASDAALRASILRSNVSAASTMEAALAFCSFALMLDVCAVLTCALQAFFAAKLIKCPQGEERAFRYLKECFVTRFVATTGLFLSIPLFVLALILYVVLLQTATAAVICTVILTLGLTFILVASIHSTVLWRAEKQNGDSAIAVYETNSLARKKAEVNLSQSELSTLV